MMRDYKSEAIIDYLRRTVGRLRKKVDNLKEKTKWRPIETAPRDGTEIILAIEDGFGVLGNRVNAIVGMFSTTDSCWVDAMNYSETYPPTHWMPVPEPPKDWKRIKQTERSIK